MGVTFTGDISTEDFNEFFGVSWEEYTAPIQEIEDRLRSRGSRIDRPWLCRDYFNKVTLPEDQRDRDPHGYYPDTKRDPQAVRQFYSSDFYSRVLAYAFLRTDKKLHRMFSHAESRPYAGEPQEDALMYACSRFGEQNIQVLDYGCGMANAVVTLTNIVPRARLFIACDIFCKARQFLGAMFAKYVHGVNVQFEYKQYWEDNLVSRCGPFHFVNCTDVLEHCHFPEEEIKRIADVMVVGGVLNLGTFFNSCQGEDVTHLEEVEVYQDTELWFGKVYDAGFELFAKDPRGAEKLFRKVG